MQSLEIPRYEKMTRELLRRHLISGSPFLTRDVGPLPSRPFSNLSQLVAYLSSKNYGGTFSHHGNPGQSFVSWRLAGNEVSLTNLPSILPRWPMLYFASVANAPADIAVVASLFDVPHFVEPNDKLGAESKWIYFGQKGPGVMPHIDSVGCVCSWSYLALGTKRWTMETPPGQTPILKTVIDQSAGDFFFWCGGYFHATEVLSDETYDVHGYLSLLHPTAADDDGDALAADETHHFYSSLVSSYAAAASAALDDDEPSYRLPFHHLMADVASACEVKANEQLLARNWFNSEKSGKVGNEEELRAMMAAQAAGTKAKPKPGEGGEGFFFKGGAFAVVVVAAIATFFIVVRRRRRRTREGGEKKKS